MQEKLQINCEWICGMRLYTQETGSQLKYYMGENQEPDEARLDAKSSNIFPKDVKGLLLQSPKHYH